MTRATSSRTSPREFASWDRDSSCWRTSEDTLLSDSTPFSGRWPTSGMTRGGCAFELPTWEPPTDASACSSSQLLPTPVADNSRGLPSKGTDYASLPNSVCALLPTPAVNDMGAGKTVEDWDAWTERMKAAH